MINYDNEIKVPTNLQINESHLEGGQVENFKHEITYETRHQL